MVEVRDYISKTFQITNSLHQVRLFSRQGFSRIAGAYKLGTVADYQSFESFRTWIIFQSIPLVLPTLHIETVKPYINHQGDVRWLSILLLQSVPGVWTSPFKVRCRKRTLTINPWTKTSSRLSSPPPWSPSGAPSRRLSNLHRPLSLASASQIVRSPWISPTAPHYPSNRSQIPVTAPSSRHFLYSDSTISFPIARRINLTYTPGQRNYFEVGWDLRYRYHFIEIWKL